MAMQLVNDQTSFSEAILTSNTRNRMRDQVTRSRGNEWMVSSYNAWQQRSPLANEPKRNSSSVLRLVRRMTPNETRISSAMAFSFKAVVLLLSLLMLGKDR